MRKILLFALTLLLIAACVPWGRIVRLAVPPSIARNADARSALTAQNLGQQSLLKGEVGLKSLSPPAVSTASAAATASAEPPGRSVPAFDHIVVIMLENRDFEAVINNPKMPYLNELAKQNVLLVQSHGVRHPSLPNYIALTGGDTFGISKDCSDCFINQTNLADLIEQSGRTWKTYQEDMPAPCTIGNDGLYMQKHDPFIYFDDIRLDTARCERSVVPLTQLSQDLQAGQLPNFSFIMPNMCHSGHDCGVENADQWLQSLIPQLQASPALGQNSLIVITYDEGDEGSRLACCGLPSTGGRIATVMISPLAKPGFVDGTPITHYGLLKTILMAWNLPDLGHSADAETYPITQPWQVNR